MVAERSDAGDTFGELDRLEWNSDIGL